MQLDWTANRTDANTSFSLKSDNTESPQLLHRQVGQKAKATDVNTLENLKADKTALTDIAAALTRAIG